MVISLQHLSNALGRSNLLKRSRSRSRSREREREREREKERERERERERESNNSTSSTVAKLWLWFTDCMAYPVSLFGVHFYFYEALSSNVGICHVLRLSCGSALIGMVMSQDYCVTSVNLVTEQCCQRDRFTVQVVPSAEMDQKRANMTMRIPFRLVQRVCIWFSLKLGHPATVTFRQMETIFGRNCYSRTTIFRWHKDFSDGRTKLGDLMRHGAPCRARNRRSVRRCKVLILQNRHVCIDQLSTTLGISHGSVFKIVRQDLKYKKKCAKLIPHALTDAQCQRRLTFCEDFLEIYEHDRGQMNWILTTDESWFYIYEPMSKVQNKEWVGPNENRPQVPRRPRSAAKLMVIPFFDRRGLVHCGFFRNVNINQRIFLPLLADVRHSIRVRRGRQVWRQRDEIHLHMDNAGPHRGRFVVDAMQGWNWPTLDHPPYSPDLSPCDFFLFPLLKKHLRGRRFANTRMLENAILHELGQITQRQWRSCFDDWLRHCRKCIQMRGQYFEGMRFPI